MNLSDVIDSMMNPVMVAIVAIVCVGWLLTNAVGCQREESKAFWHYCETVQPTPPNCLTEKIQR